MSLRSGLGLGAVAAIAVTIVHLGATSTPLHLNPESPILITESKSKEVFGYGDGLGISVTATDEVRFVFAYAESIPVVYYLNFEGSTQRPQQVSLSLNGHRFDFVRATEKPQRIKLPKRDLKKGADNSLVLRNERGKERVPPPWAVRNAKLVIRPLPACAEDDCQREAQALYTLGLGILAKPSADALPRAWTALQEALLFLENLEGDPDLRRQVIEKLRSIDVSPGACERLRPARPPQEPHEDFPCWKQWTESWARR